MRLVLMPGMDGSGKLFQKFMQALPEDFTVHAMQYPADAWMSYPDLAERMEREIPAEPFVLIAESYSTPLAICMAGSRPERLLGVVLVAGFATTPLKGWRRVLCSRLAPLLVRLQPPKFLVRLFLLGKGAPRELIEAVRLALQDVRREVLLHRIRQVLLTEMRAELGRISKPILYLQPTRDRLVSSKCILEARRVKSGTTTSVVGPHLLLQRKPELCAKIITAFVRDL